jgi:hypothetical protein
MKKLIVFLLLVVGAQAQNPSGILDASRYVDWSTAGVPGGIPSPSSACVATISPTGNNAAIASNGLTLAGTTTSVTASLTSSTAFGFPNGSSIAVVNAVDSNNTIWTNSGFLGQFTATVTGVTTLTYTFAMTDWLPSHTYGTYTYVFDGTNMQVVTASTGTSGAIRPTWNVTVGGTTTDNRVTWTNIGHTFGGGLVGQLDSAASALIISAVANASCKDTTKYIPLAAGNFFLPAGLQIHQSNNVTIIGAGSTLTFLYATTPDSCGGISGAICILGDNSHFYRYNVQTQVCGTPYSLACNAGYNQAQWVAGFTKGTTAPTLCVSDGTGITPAHCLKSTTLTAGKIIILDVENSYSSLAITAATASGSGPYTYTYTTSSAVPFSNGTAIVVGGVHDGSNNAIAAYNIRGTASGVSGSTFQLTGSTGPGTGSGGNVMVDDGSPVISDQQNIFRPKQESPGESRCRLPATSDANCATVIAAANGGADLGAQMRNKMFVAKIGTATFNDSGDGAHGTYTVTFADSLGLPLAFDLATDLNPGAWWLTASSTVGLKNLRVDTSSATGSADIAFYSAYSGWLKNVAMINRSTNSALCRNHIWGFQSSHLEIRDSYLFGYCKLGSKGYGIEPGLGGGYKVENNIIQNLTAAILAKAGIGNVWAYNYFNNCIATNGVTGTGLSITGGHDAGSMYSLSEGNIGCQLQADMFHGVSFANTSFRDYWNGRNASSTNFTIPINAYVGIRALNVIGDVLGTAAYHTQYESNAPSGTNAYHSIYTTGWPGAGNPGCGTGAITSDGGMPCDAYVLSGMMRWGNCDAVHGFSAVNCRFESAEVPTSYGSYSNTVPASNVLPSSFYLSGKPSWWLDIRGGTTLPWPGIGPDITGGTLSGVGGLANPNPAYACFAGTPATNGVLNFDADACYTGTIAPYTISAACQGQGTGTLSGTDGMSATCTAGVLSGSVTSVSHSDGDTPTYTKSTSDTFFGWFGICTGTGACTPTIHSSGTIGVNFGFTVTTSLTASPTNINAGQSSTLTWSSSGNPTFCSLTDQFGNTYSNAASGTQSVTPPFTTKYALFCQNDSSSSESDATVTVTGYVQGHSSIRGPISH